MKYLALGDSVSIDKYTGVEHGGAVNQFSKLIGADELQDLTHDGFTTDAVIGSLEKISMKPDVITLTLGGNDLLQRPSWNIDRYSLKDPNTKETLKKLHYIYSQLYRFNCKVIVNTIYDPTDGDEALLRQLGMSEKFREAYDDVNNAIRKMARRYGFLLSDLQQLFLGHGINSADTWLTMEIEPNHAGATAIANHWYQLFLEPDKGMVLTDVHDGWSFSLAINKFQYEYKGEMNNDDNQWLLVSFRVASPDESWHWTDPSLMFDEVKMLSAWLADIAAGNSTTGDIDFLEPEIRFKLLNRTNELITLRVYIYNPDAQYASRSKHGFRQIWARSEQPLTKPVNPDYMIPMVYKDYVVTPQNILKASQSLLDNLRQLPSREGLSADDIG
ncbi:MAG: SGNH/GDSL hydrolase family protein [Armatimonadota bacterium]